MPSDEDLDETYEEAGYMAPMPVAATRDIDGEQCMYDCENDADYRVQLEDGQTFVLCQSCSTENRIYAKENDLLKHEVTADAE